MKDFFRYGVRLQQFLKGRGLSIGSFVHLSLGGHHLSCQILPPFEGGEERYLNLKLSDGHRLAFDIEEIDFIKETDFEALESPSFREPPLRDRRHELGCFLFVEVGKIVWGIRKNWGEILSLFSSGDKWRLCHESCCLDDDDYPDEAAFWEELARFLALHFRERDIVACVLLVEGIQQTSLGIALAFALQGLSFPLVLVGREELDAFQWTRMLPRLRAAFEVAAVLPHHEVVHLVPWGADDRLFAVYRATHSRRLFSTYRAGIRALGDEPLALFDFFDLKWVLLQEKKEFSFEKNFSHEGGELLLQPHFDRRTHFIQWIPHQSLRILEVLYALNPRGLLLSGIGRGYLPTRALPFLKNLRRQGVHLYISSEALWGQKSLLANENSTLLKQLGIRSAGSMLPEVAFIKLAWLLAQFHEEEKVAELMEKSLVGEFSGALSATLVQRFSYSFQTGEEDDEL